MDNNIIKIDEEGLKNDLKGVIRKTIEETLNTMLDEEAAELIIPAYFEPPVRC